MRLRAISIGIVLIAACASTSDAAVRISRDHGGQIGPYLYAFSVIRQSGERVIIDGPCLSACTLVLAVLPRERICVTRRAQLGFHAAWSPDEDGRLVVNRPGTKIVLGIYPPPVRNRIIRNGGLGRKMIFLQGRELASMYPTCQ